MTFSHRLLYLLLPLLLLFAACHQTPDHASYIPKNALMVAEVNTKELSKKIAWSMITGSNLWDRVFGKKSPKDTAKQSEFIKNMQEAGVDELNTFYAYLKNTGSNEKEACFVALIPLKDAMKWESFVKKTFSEAVVKDNKKRKEARLSEEIYAGWTNNLLIIISVQKADDYGFENDMVSSAAVDEELLLASHLESAFNVSKDNSLLSDERFAAFEKHKHDLGFWVNIDAVMSNYGSKNIGMMTGGLSLSNTMWRNSAFSAATNFEKGRIVTDMLMYSSDSLKEINKQYSNKNVDEDVINRIPNVGLDYILTYHISPEGTLKTMEKMGLLGAANGFLKEQNLSVEEIVSAISGDMVFSINNYQQKKEMVLFDSADASSAFGSYKTDKDALFALRLNKKESFQKLINLAVQKDILEQVKPGTYKLKDNSGSEASSYVIMIDDKFAVFTNKAKLGEDYLKGTFSSMTPLKVKEHIYKHPFGMFFDYNSWAKRTGAILLAGSPADSLVFSASVKTFDNFVFNGGNLSNNAFKYQMCINFVDKQQSSLIQLFDFGKVIQEAQELREKEMEEYYQLPYPAEDSVAL